MSNNKSFASETCPDFPYDPFLAVLKQQQNYSGYVIIGTCAYKNMHNEPDDHITFLCHSRVPEGIDGMNVFVPDIKTAYEQAAEFAKQHHNSIYRVVKICSVKYEGEL